jgi:PAS domain S-box-containing protein
MKIQAKLFLLMCFLWAIFIAIFFAYRDFERRVLLSIFTNQMAQQKISLSKILKLEEQGLEAFVRDYSLWDEMKEYVSTGNKAWEEVNLNKNVLSTYNADALWVYRPDGSLMDSVSNLEAGELDNPSFSKEFFDKLSREHLGHFFISTKNGLMEMEAATIHSTADINRKTPGQGYLLAARLWDASYMADLAKLSGNKLRLRKFSIVKTEQLKKSKKEAKEKFSFPKLLQSWDGSVSAYLEIAAVSDEIDAFNRHSRGYLILFLVCAALGLSIVASYLWTSVGKPLHLITRTLKSENPNYLAKLKTENSEFGQVSFLVANFFLQKSDLLRQIRERIDAQLQLQKQKDEQQLILDSVPAFVFYKDTQNRFIRTNKAFEDALGLSRNELEGKFIHEIFPPEQSEAYWKDDKEVIASGQPKNNIIEPMQTPNGVRWVQTDKIPIRDGRGNIIGIIGFAVDITERKEAEEELKTAYDKLKETQNQLIQSEKMEVVGRIASGVAHEVKNPLAIILQGLDYLLSEKEPAKGKVAASLLKKMNDAVLRADNIIKSLLNFSSVSELNVSSHDLLDVLESSLLLMEHYLNKYHIGIVREFKDNPSIKIDKTKIEQVFVNLIMNAVEAMPEGGKIMLRTYMSHVTKADKGVGLRKDDMFIPGEQAAVVEIEDTGSGIAEADMDKIFDPFFTTKRDKGGTGLGLSVVKSIIDSHRATIDINNKAKGSGIVVTLRFKA